MIVARRGAPNRTEPSLRAVERSQPNRSSLLQRFALIYVVGTFVLLPVQFIVLPLNMSPVELWNLLTLPILWLYLLKIHQEVRLAYGRAIWLILIGSLVGMFSEVAPLDSMIAIVKDVYLYVWFVTVVAVLCSFDAVRLRRLLMLWAGVVIVNGILILAQFASVDVFRTVFDLAARYGPLDPWRPSGLFENANSTGLYQMLGLVPIFLVRPSRLAGTILGLYISATILATGSFAATGGLVVGLLGALILGGMLGLRFGAMRKAIGQIALMTAIVAGVAYGVLAGNQDFEQHFRDIFYGRLQGSATGRFELWDRGLELLSSESSLWGIGPDAYRTLDLLEKPLHNDLLEFLVERGVIGMLGLLLFAGTAVAKAIEVPRRSKSQLDQSPALSLVFLIAVIAIIVNGQFHQVFHERSVWLVLALLEVPLLNGQAVQSAPSTATAACSEFPTFDRPILRRVLTKPVPWASEVNRAR